MSDAVQEDRELVSEQAGLPTPLEVQLDSQKAIARIGAIAQVIEGCAKASIQRTNAADWVKMGKGYYLQASGAQKIRSIWGIYYRDRSVTKEANPDGSYSYIVSGTVGSKVMDQLYGEVTIEIDGGRSSNDPFFAKGNREPDPLDVRKASLSNWEARAVSTLLGLKNLSDADLERNGIKVAEITGVSYASGAEGGGNTNVISDGQRKRLWAISKEQGITEQALKTLLEAYGFPTTNAVTRATYEEIVTTVQGGNLAIAKRIAEKVKTQQDNGERL